MKHEKKLTALVAALISFVIAWGAAGCFLSAFGLSLEHPALWVLICGAAAVLSGVLLTFRYGTAVMLCLLALAGGYLYRDGTAQDQLLQLLHYLTTIYNRPYGLGVFPLPEGLSAGTAFDFPLSVWGVTMAVTAAYSICRRKSVWLPVLTAILPLCSCIVVTDTVPGEGWLIMFLSGLILLILTSPVRCEDAFQGLWLTAVATPAVVLVLAALFLSIPQESYVNHSAVLRENIQIAVRNAPRILDSGLAQLSAKIQPQPPRHVDLSSLGARVPFTYPVMTVTAEKSGTLYLRGQDYDVYDGLAWSTSGDRIETFSFTGAASQEVTVTMKDRKDFRYLPYYPDRDTVLTGGFAKNPRSNREYTVSQSLLPENWRQTAYQVSALPNGMEPYLSLPERTRQEADEILQHLYSNAISNTAKADIIAALVTDSARYDLNAPKMPAEEPDFALWFLREGELGYCVHFATAATVLLRAAGVPARYVTGYMLEAVSGEAVRVTEENAHAWAEYYEPNLGLWIPLEATPSSTPIPEVLPSHPISTAPSLSDAPEHTPPQPSLSVTAPTVSDSPDIPLILPDPSTAQEIPQKLPLWALLLFLPILILPGQRILRLHLRRRGQQTGKSNAQALYRWRETLRLSRILKEKTPEELMQLAQKAKFSQYELTPEELTQFDCYHRSALQRLREKPWYVRLIYQYIYAVY